MGKGPSILEIVTALESMVFCYAAVVFPAFCRKRAEYGFGEYGFKHRTQWVFGPHRVPGRELSEFLSAYYLCAKANSPSSSQNSPSLPQNSVRLSEFSSPKQYSRNSIPPVSYSVPFSCLFFFARKNKSGKKKAHKHKSFWPVTPPVTGRSPDREARGQSFMYYRQNPRNINLFVRIPDREDRWPGRPEKFYVQKFYVPFLLPNKYPAPRKFMQPTVNHSGNI